MAIRDILWITLTAICVCMSFSAQAMEPTDLRCEALPNPMGIDTHFPRLSWVLKSSQQGDTQTAYQVIALSGPDIMWDSGKVLSDNSIYISYRGQSLKSSQKMSWKVRVWDRKGKVSSWSAPATWTMGILTDADWQAKWISAEGARAGARQFIGYHAAETKQEDDVKWVQVDLGKSTSISSIRLHPMDHQDIKGFGFPVRFKIEANDSIDFQSSNMISDQTGADYANPGYQPVSFNAGNVHARYIRVTATKLGKFTAGYCFALSQIEVLSDGRNVAVGAKPSAKDSVENFGWGLAGINDGIGIIGTRSTHYETMLLRHQFIGKPGVKRAVAHVCGLGQYELTINGRKVGEDLLTPGWSKYDKTCLYDTYDITSLINKGSNAVGMILGNGMYNVHGGRYTKFTGTFGPLKAIAQIRLDYIDGSTEIFGTDQNWQVLSGPITFSCVYGGEDYDARLEPTGWNKPDFVQTKWEKAAVVEGPGGVLKGLSCAAAPIKAIEVLKPVSIKELRPGVTVYDMGQNVSMMPRIKVQGPAGSTVKITPAELLNQDGSVDRGSAGGGEAYWKYTLSGSGSETYFPKFFYHGSRYLQVETKDALVKVLEGVVVHSASPPVGMFSCSNELFNKIHTLIRWAQRSNMVSVLTDCPHRERLGWLEQDYLNGPSLRYEFDLTGMFTKAMNDMADSQLDDGLVPDIAPEYVKFGGGFRDSPEWGSAFVIVPWQQYQWNGDIELLRTHYDVMKRYVAYLGSKSKDHIVSHGLGDWFDIGPNGPGMAQLTPLSLTATSFYYYDAWIIAQIARLLGKDDDAKTFQELADTIRDAFNKEFYKPETGQYSTGSQCANAIPLVMDMVEPANRAKVLENIVKDVRTRGNALTAGDIGYRYLLTALAEGGRSDVIFDMNNQSEKPGYGMQLKRGATSLTEAWDAGRGSSQNHFMLGHIMEWFYHDISGIGSDPNGPGYKKIIIKPVIVGDLTWARGSYYSVHGKISSEWKRADNVLTMLVTIPPNTTATVYVPGAVVQADGAKQLRDENGVTVYAIESGSYRFSTNMKP